jgi:glycosyltransferase involved in cell wall biosynthesis
VSLELLDPSRPRVLFVSRTRHELPLREAESRKFVALATTVEWHLLARGARPHDDDAITLIGPSRLGPLDGLWFNLRLAVSVARLARRCRPEVVIAQDPFVGASALLARPFGGCDYAVVVEVHGDWRTATRLYGRRLRRLLAVPADAVARRAIRSADAVRAISAFTARLAWQVGVRVDAVFPTFLDLRPFTVTPVQALPDVPTALFVGVLERYKNIDGLLAAWPAVRERVPDAKLRIVGNGSMAGLVARHIRGDSTIEHRLHLSRAGLAAALDGSTCLVIPSRSEGMGRVVAEAFARGRSVVAAAVGGLPELVSDGGNGVLVAAGDDDMLADALATVLGDRRVAAAYGAAAAAYAARLPSDPVRYADDVRRLVDIALARRAGLPDPVPVQEVPEPVKERIR